MKKVCCPGCARAVSADEVALNQRLLGMQIGCFYCADCLARRMGTTTERLHTLIARFKELGCAYFTRLEEKSHGEEQDSM